MNLETRLRRTVVDPLFAGRTPAVPGGLPAAVVRSRENRARQRILDALLVTERADVPEHTRTQLAGLVAEWAERGFADAFEPAEAFEIECARTAERVGATGAYRRWLQDRYGWIELRGLQVSHRIRTSLEDTFVPLSVHLVAPDESDPLSALASFVRKPVAEVREREPRLLIVGAPGSGKSTLVAWLATNEAERVPFVVLARSVRGPWHLVAEIARQAEVDEGFVRTALPNALLLVDGVDEAGDPAAFAASIEQFAADFPDTRIVVTSRPAGVTDLRGFTQATMAPMTRADVTTFVDKWCLAAETSVRSDRAAAELAARHAAADLKGRIRSSRPVERLAENPLMCGVICLVHRFLGERIPERRVALYEACTNVLLYEWDRTKFAPDAAIGTLDAHQKRGLLGALALHMHEGGVAELPEVEVRRIFDRELPAVTGTRGARGRGKQILAEIRDRSGLLVERSPGVFAFSHLSFQEYLVALRLVDAGKTLSLVERAEDEWWGEVIVLAAGIPGAQAAALIRGLLARPEPTEGVGRAPILAALCVESAVSVPVSVRKAVEERLEGVLGQDAEQRYYALKPLAELALPLLLRRVETLTDSQRLLTIRLAGGVQFVPSLAVVVKHLSHPSKYIRGMSILVLRRLSDVSVEAWEVLTAYVASEEGKATLEEVPLAAEFLSDFPITEPPPETSAPTPAAHTG